MPNIAFTHPKLDHSILELLVDNMTRFNEAEEADRQGIYHVLGIFENFVGSKPELAERLALKTKLLPWLLNRAQSKTHDENRGYATELLSILLQGSQLNRLELGKNDGVEILLNIASVRCKFKSLLRKSHTSHSNFVDETLPMLTRPNLWRTFLIRYVPPLLKRKSKIYF
jgi:beta-catenin-like protein 1